MRWAWLGVLAVLAACAARQPAPAEAKKANGWKDVEVAEIHGRCYAGWVDRGIEGPKASAMCDCIVPQLTDRYSFGWFNDGQQVTPTEAHHIQGIQEACARKVATRTDPSTPSSEGTGSGMATETGFRL